MIPGRAPAMVALEREVAMVAPQPVPVMLVVGETGSGKALVARRLHYALAARRRAVRRAQRRRHPRDARRVGAVRPRARRLLRRARAQARPGRGGRRRHAVPRRDRRPAGAGAGQAAHVPRVVLLPPRRRHRHAHRRRAARRRHQPRPRRPSAKDGRFRADLVLPPERDHAARCRRCASGARTSRRWRRTSSSATRSATASRFARISRRGGGACSRPGRGRATCASSRR